MLTIWHHNALRPKRDGEDIPTEKPRLARTTFPDTFEVERLISKKIVKH